MPHRDKDWKAPDGLARSEVVDHWRDFFATHGESPIDISVYEPEDFAWKLVSRGIGQLRMIHLQAPAQHVLHHAIEHDLAQSDHLIHLIWAISGGFDITAEGEDFRVEEGHFVLLHNSRTFELDIRTRHEAIDLIMPLPWLEQHLPDPLAWLRRPAPMGSGWAPPLGCLLETIAREGEDYPLPRPLLAEQIGRLVALALGVRQSVPGKAGTRIAEQIMRRIEADFADPELSVEAVAKDLKISKRYLQALLANSGTSFMRELTAARLDRANILLTDPHTRAVPVAEVAFRCGFLDPGYFARQFRKRFNATPRGWRAMN